MAERLTSYGLQTGGRGSDRVSHLTADLCSTGEDQQKTTTTGMMKIKNDLFSTYRINLTLVCMTDCLIVMIELQMCGKCVFRGGMRERTSRPLS